MTLFNSSIYTTPYLKLSLTNMLQSAAFAAGSVESPNGTTLIVVNRNEQSVDWERLWRRLKTPDTLESWKSAFEIHRQLLQQKQAEFTRRKIEENKDNSKEQWKILNSILTSSNQENSCPLAAVAFQSFFTKKVEDIRSLTAGSTPPTVLPRTLSKLEGFERSHQKKPPLC